MIDIVTKIIKFVADEVSEANKEGTAKRLDSLYRYMIAHRVSYEEKVNAEIEELKAKIVSGEET